MEKKIPPLWEVKEIYQGKQVLSYGFYVETEQEARALYEGSCRIYPESTLEARRVDGILTKNAPLACQCDSDGKVLCTI